MTSENPKTSKEEALSLAKQQHVPVQEFLNQEPTRTDLRQGLIDKRGEGRELILLTCLLGAEKPVSAKYFGWPKSTASNAVKELDTYLQEFSNTIEPLKGKRKKICIPRQKGGLNVGYHFACLNAKSTEYLDGAMTERLLENLWDDYIRIELRKKLEQEAIDELSKKLQGRNDYQALDMEIGVVPQKTKENEINDAMGLGNSKTYAHNRAWESFSIDSLINSSDSSSYIISVDAGGGKTTFLRHLQLEILRKSEFIPVFLDASKIEERKLENRGQLAEKLASFFDLDIHEDRVVDFLIRNLEEKVVLMVDGLDQIKAGGSEYEYLLNHIFNLMGKRVIIASRPSAVINQEDEKQFTFLRLKPFNIVVQKNYFGDKFDRAKQLSMNTPDLIAIPMLANMTRMLIEEKQDGNINNRTKLYEKFIEYILTKYKHGKVKLSPGLRTKIIMSLGKIAYDALAEKEPHIQKIPLDFCYDEGRLPDNPKEGKDELLTKSGLVNLIIERSGWGGKDFLLFTHQSFQEYLAAEYISQDDDRIQQVLNEKWNPKWKEVVRFLTGLNGQEIIEKILLEKDNPINSKLFLSAELVPETDVDANLKKRMSQKIEELLEHPSFNYTAGIFWLYVNEVKAVSRLLCRLKDSGQKSRPIEVDTLRFLESRIGDEIVGELLNRFVGIIEDKEGRLVERISVIDGFRYLEPRMDDEITGQLVNRFMEMIEDEEENYWVNRNVVHTLISFGDRINDKVLGDFVSRLVGILEEKDGNSWPIHQIAIFALMKFESRIDDKTLGRLVNRLMEIIENKDDCSEVRDVAIDFLRHIEKRIEGKVVVKVIDSLMEVVADKTNFFSVRQKAIAALMKLESRMDNSCLEKLIDSFMGVAWDDLDMIRRTAMCSLGDLENRMNDEAAGELVNSYMRVIRNKNEEYDVIWGALYALGKLESRIDDKIMEEVISRFVEIVGHYEEEFYASSAGISTLCNFESKMDDKVADDLINKFVKIVVDKSKKDNIRFIAVDALKCLVNRMDEEIIAKLADNCVVSHNDKIVALLRELYEHGRLEFLVRD